MVASGSGAASLGHLDDVIPTVTAPVATLPTVTVPRATAPSVPVPSVVATLPSLPQYCKNNGQPDRYGLWLADVDRRSMCLLMDDKVLGSVTFSPDDHRVAFTAQDGSTGDGRIPSHLYVVDSDGSGLRLLDPTSNVPRQPSWSPDGRWLAYTRWPVDSNGDSALMLLEWATGAMREIGRIDQGSSKLEWSPDSQRIAATEFNRRDVLTVTIPEGISTRVAVPGDSMPYMCSWSPDGRQLVVSGERGPVVITDGTGANPRTLVADGRFARWSPSGSVLSVWRDFNAFVVDPDGGGLRQVQPNASPIDWSGDGRLLATQGGTTAIDAVNVADGSLTPVARGTNTFEVGPAGWSWSGHTLAVVVERSAAYRY